MHQNNEAYLSFGLISSAEKQLCSKSAVYGAKLANQTMVSHKTEKYRHTKHSLLCKKLTEYFESVIVY
jgi:hypothetical protein